MTTRRIDCLVAGDANVDLLVEGVLDLKVGTERLAQDCNLTLGGSSAITAFNLSRLGAKVSFAGVLGEDMFGRFVEEKLTSGGVRVSGIRRTKKAKTGITIWHTRRGERAGVTYAGTIAMLDARHVTEMLPGARHLHVGAYFMQSRLHADAPKLFARAKKLGLTTSVDCNYDPLEQWDSNLRNVLKHSDLFFPNEDEALKITGAPDITSAARQLAQWTSTVVVKQGAKGVFVVTPSAEFHLPGMRAKVVDTTGAGDSFNAGFLAQYLKGASIRVCAKAGVEAGARCVRYAGGTTAFES